MISRLGTDPLHLEDPSETVDRIVRFLKTHAERTRARCLIVGMSGGLDSSVAAALCSKAVGGRKTMGFRIPEIETLNPTNIRDAEEIARKFGITIRSVDISSVTDAMRGVLHRKKKDRIVPWGNVKARLRALILYYYANLHHGLVVGTGDKSEIMLGYFTKYGDGACDIQPLADLYKTSLRQLASYLQLPSRIYSKPSSPELWPGQTAKKELGLEYEKIDVILWGLERWMSPSEISRIMPIPISTVEKIRKRWLLSEHKRRPPLAMKLGFRTPGQDLRVPSSL